GERGEDVGERIDELLLVLRQDGAPAAAVLRHAVERVAGAAGQAEAEDVGGDAVAVVEVLGDGAGVAAAGLVAVGDEEHVLPAAGEVGVVRRRDPLPAAAARAVAGLAAGVPLAEGEQAGADR